MIYLDSAATTLQKPPSVFQAVLRAGRTLASPGRGGYPASMAAADTVFQCRETAARLLGAAGAEQVVMTHNATHGLNIAIHSLIRPGMRVVISGYEHNAVTRPLSAIPDLTVEIAQAPLFQPEQMVEEFSRLLPHADAAICCHVSNVFGYVLPVGEIARLCRQNGVPLIVDAAQSAGIQQVDAEGWGAAFVAMPGHKGLYGPQGTGLLLCGRDITAEPFLYGGTGSESKRQEMPGFLPDRLEAGTLNVCGIAGLLEGLRFVERTGADRIAAHEQHLTNRLAALLKDRCGGLLTICHGAGQSGVLSVVPQTMGCETLGQELAGAGIAVRAGCHCAPLAHTTAGTLDTGTVRFSCSAFTQEEEIRTAAAAVERILKKNGKSACQVAQKKV